MMMKQNMKIQHWIQNFLQKSSDKAHSAMFIRNYNDHEYTYEDFDHLLGDDLKDGFFYHSFSKESFKSPYEPFFDAIKFYYDRFYAQTMTIEEFVDACGVYSLQKEIFCSFLLTGVAKRNEFIMIAEIDFEKQKMISSIFGCLNYLAQKHPLVFLLNHLQYSCPSTLVLIRKIVEQSNCCNARFICIYDESRSSISSLEDEFEHIIAVADNNDMLYEIENTEAHDCSMEYHSFFTPVAKHFNQYLDGLNNLYYTLALDDMAYYIHMIYDKVSDESLKLSNEQSFNFYSFAAFCFTLMGDHNRAMLMSEHLLPLFDEEKNPDLSYRYNYICGYIQLASTQIELCNKYANRCLSIAQKLGNDRLVFYAEVLLVAAQFGGWRSVFLMDFTKIKPDDRMLLRYKQYNFKNTLAHYLTYAYDNDTESIKRFVSGVDSKTYLEAKRLSEEIGNIELQLSLYTKYVVLFTEKGFYKMVDRFYDEKIRIFENEKNDQRLANLYLGMGYNNIVSEKYELANEQFTKAIELLYQLKRPEEIAEALYNLVQNNICVEDYVSCRDYMLTLFNILDALSLETLQLCNATKLYALLAMSYYKLGNEYRCFRYVKCMEALLSDMVKDLESSKIGFSRENEVIFLYYLLEAVMSMNNNRMEEAGKYFQKARYYFAGYSGVLFYAIIFFVTEYHEYYIRIGDTRGAESILEYGISYCTQNGYTQKAGILRAKALGQDYCVPKLPHLNDSISLEDLSILADHVGKEKQLYKQKNDIRFLSSWQELLNRYDTSWDTLMTYTINSLQDNFNLEYIFFLKFTNGVPKVVYENPKLQENDILAITDFFHVVKKEFVANRTEKTFLEYMNLLQVFHNLPVFTLIGIPIYNESGLVCIFLGASNINIHERSLMNEDDLGILKTAIGQLNNSLDRIHDREDIIEINRQLNKLAITDNLTGLYNRQGLDKMLHQNLSCHNTMCILYVDLDNFKYCNDTFGHDIGDLVLKEFASLFERVSQGCGYAVRYGGDEFLIILHDRDILDAKRIANEIYDYIGDGFHSLISSYVGHEISVPIEKRLTCSIGIMSSVDGSLEHMSDALKKADEALYYMKRNSKGHCIAWTDI